MFARTRPEQTRRRPGSGTRHVSARLRVLIVVQNLSVPLDRRVWLECQALVAAGFGVSVVCPQAPGEASDETLDGVRIRRYPAPPESGNAATYAREFVWCWLQTARLVRQAWHEERFDVMQACNPPDTYWLLARMLKPLGVRFVYDQHDLCPELFLARFTKPSRRLSALLEFLERRTYATADHVITPNESYRHSALSRGHCSPDEVTVVRSGPDTRAMQQHQQHPELRHGRRHLLCYLGVMGPQDGVENLIRAYAALLENGRDDVHLAVLGFGDRAAAVGALVEELGLGDRVTLTGRADKAMIDAYLSTAALGLAPDPLNSFNDVSTMNKVMEYMAYGLPTVTYDLAESRVTAGNAALYVKGATPAAFAGGIAALLADDPRREQMGVAARARCVERWDWSLQAKVYVEVYAAMTPVPATPAGLETVSVPLPRTRSAGAVSAFRLTR